MAELYEDTKALRKYIEKQHIREWLFVSPRSIGGWVLRVLLLLLGLPLFAAAMSATWFVFLAPLVVNSSFIKDRQFKGSINLAVTLLVTFPLCGLVPAIVMLCKGLILAGLGYLVVYPLLIIFAINYMRWGRKVLGYARYVFAKRSKKARITSLREKLYRELMETL